ncbi:MAG: gfo/Idh/MocA family oxidoreductase, partial [Prochlorothrix sp.]
CVRGGDQPSVGGEQALKALRLASLIEEMAASGQDWTSQISVTPELLTASS